MATVIKSTKTINCREHGGMFTIEARRGRPPVRCTEDNPCTPNRLNTERVKKAIGGPVIAAKRKRADALQAARQEVATVMAAPPAEKPAERRAAKMPPKALTHARKAANLLRDSGWTVTGRASADGISVIGAREQETIALHWRPDGTHAQDYMLWDMEQPSANDKPESKLNFDPDEMPDRELVQHLSGMKVTWWNRLSGGEETAVIGNTLTIEHCYNGAGNETPADRIIKFVDLEGKGFRHFRVGALINVGWV